MKKSTRILLLSSFLFLQIFTIDKINLEVKIQKIPVIWTSGKIETQSKKMFFLRSKYPFNLTSKLYSTAAILNINTPKSIIPLEKDSVSKLNYGIPCSISDEDICKYINIPRSFSFNGYNYQSLEGSTVFMPVNQSISFNPDIYRTGPVWDFNFLTSDTLPFNQSSLFALSPYSDLLKYITDQYLDNSFFIFGLELNQTHGGVKEEFYGMDYDMYNGSNLTLNGYDKRKLDGDGIKWFFANTVQEEHHWGLDYAFLFFGDSDEDLGFPDKVCFSWSTTAVITTTESKASKFFKMANKAICGIEEGCNFIEGKTDISLAPVIKFKAKTDPSNQNYDIVFEFDYKDYVFVDEGVVKYSIDIQNDVEMLCGSKDYFVLGLPIFKKYKVIFSFGDSVVSPNRIGFGKYRVPINPAIF